MSQDARRVVGALPRVVPDGAPGWVLAEMAVRVDALLADGRTPVEIVRAAEVVPPIGPRGYMDALHGVRAALRAGGCGRQADEAAAGVVRCEGCGARRTGTATCDPVEVLAEIDAPESLWDSGASARVDSLRGLGWGIGRAPGLVGRERAPSAHRPQPHQAVRLPTVPSLPKR
ncbi:hypothetical protein AB0C84_44715 [Actinomadura sp. NPDC048955]|uniref:hypothetical protein n=1 Tax=Actinomadura sp. NPDC048955 TaxID=3158228 RepID=UPI003405E51C